MVDLNHVVRETLSLRAYEQRITNITIVDALASGLPQVFADAHQVQQVLLNLIINAEQAMLTANGRGTLVVRSWHDIEREAVVLEINDDGPGIAEELQPKIFDPFFTTKEVGKGTGLGLTVAYAIVQEHGGRIRLASKAALAHRSTSSCPSAARRSIGRNTAAASRFRIARRIGRPRGRGRARTRGCRKRGADDAGFIVDRAGDGEEALRRVGEKAYDLIVCDLKMPKIDGMRFHQKLVVSHPERRTRVIFVTGDVAGTEAERFLQDSGCRWLAKPFRLGDLLRTAREILTARPRFGTPKKRKPANIRGGLVDHHRSMVPHSPAELARCSDGNPPRLRGNVSCCESLCAARRDVHHHSRRFRGDSDGDLLGAAARFGNDAFAIAGF